MNSLWRMIKEEKGFAMIIAVFALALLSIFSIAIINVSASNYKMTKVDSKSQAAYYIAEAGVNYIIDQISKEIEENGSKYNTSVEFFQHIEEMYTTKTFTLEDFEVNNGEKPKAIISVSKNDEDENIRDYRIESVGIIGDSSRSVDAIISIICHTNENEVTDQLIFYAEKFRFLGTSVNAVSGSIIMDGIETHDLNGGSLLNISNMYFNGPVKMNGGSASFGSEAKPGSIYVNGDLEFWNGTRNVYGDIRVNGNFRLKDAIIHGNVYVNGDLELSWTPDIKKNIYYTGDLIITSNGIIIDPKEYNQDLLNKCIKVNSLDSFQIPIIDFSLREDSWYKKNGYTIIEGNVSTTVPDNARWLVDNYNYTGWPQWDINDGYFTNVVIVSKGNITINTGTSFTGALIAPNGIVQLPQGGTNFNGVIISKKGIEITGGGSIYNLKSLKEVFDNESIPFIYNIQSEDNSGNGTLGSIEISIKRGIKETQ